MAAEPGVGMGQDETIVAGIIECIKNAEGVGARTGGDDVKFAGECEGAAGVGPAEGEVSKDVAATGRRDEAAGTIDLELELGAPGEVLAEVAGVDREIELDTRDAAGVVHDAAEDLGCPCLVQVATDVEDMRSTGGSGDSETGHRSDCKFHVFFLFLLNALQNTRPHAHATAPDSTKVGGTIRHEGRIVGALKIRLADDAFQRSA